MRLVCVSELFPLPPDLGSAVRVLALAEALDQVFDVHFLLLRRPETTAAQVAEARRHFHGTVEVFAPPRRSSGRVDVLRTWARAAQRQAPPWVVEEFSPAMAERLVALSPGAAGIVLLFDRGLCALALPAGSPPVVTDRHEVEGWAFNGLELGALPRRERLRTLAAGRLVRRLENRLLRRCDVVVVTSAEEDDRLLKLYGRPATAVVPSAIRPMPLWQQHDGAPTLGYLGALDYRPNVDGLARFVAEGWARAAQPPPLIIAGRSPAPSVLALQAHPGLEVINVSDHFDEFLRTFLARIHVGVVPLWSGGAGVKLKTLTLLGSGVPTVVTPAAAQGLPVAHGVHCLIADDPPGLARAATNLLQDRELAFRLGSTGRQLVHDGFTWATTGPRFTKLVRDSITSVDERGAALS